MKLEYTLINGSSEPEFQKYASEIEFGRFTVLQAITPEAQDVIHNTNSSNVESVIAAFTNPKIMNGIPIKGFPYLCMPDPEDNSYTAFYIGREALNYEFDMIIYNQSTTPFFSDILKLHIIEKDGSITKVDVEGIGLGTDTSWKDSSVDNIIFSDDVNNVGFKYWIGGKAR